MMIIIGNVVNSRIIELFLVKSEYNIADLLTKLTNLGTFKQLQLFGYN